MNGIFWVRAAWAAVAAVNVGMVAYGILTHGSPLAVAIHLGSAYLFTVLIAALRSKPPLPPEQVE